MNYLGTILCVEYSEIVPKIISKNLYDQWKFRKECEVTIHGQGGNGRKVLIEYESLPDKYKLLVQEVYGDPYEYAANQVLLGAVKWDIKAEQYFREYETQYGYRIPDSDTDALGKPCINYVARYTRQASWLNMIGQLSKDRAGLKKVYNLSMDQFWSVLQDLVKIELNDKCKCPFPTHPKAMRRKLKAYTEGGFQALIVDEHKWGNVSALKIHAGHLKSFLELRNRHDNVEVAEEYNNWAIDNNYPKITQHAVRYWRKQWEDQLRYFEEGKAAFDNKVKKQITTNRASAPLLKIEGDDNIGDFYFFQPETTKVRGDKVIKVPKNEWFNLAIYFVKDTYNDLILGYACGHTVTKELIYSAFRDANRYVRRMTGDDYMWHQIQTDRWGINAKGKRTELRAFFEEQAPFTPPPAGHARSKRIEASFGTVHHKKLKRIFPDNYSGHNIKAQQKLNPDTLDPKKFPHIKEAPLLMAQFVQAMRDSKREGSELTREQEWLQAFANSEKSQARKITAETRLRKLGRKHEETNKITARGITPTLKNAAGKSVKMQYELSQELIFNRRGEDMAIYYDPVELDEVLITNGGTFRQVVQRYERANNAIADQTEWDRKRLKDQMQEQETVGDLLEKWNEDVTPEMVADAAARMKAGVMPKEIGHHDQGILTAVQNGRKPVPEKVMEKELKESNNYYAEW